jgi:glycosyltransferase involved in cell wall biosynthesis
MSDVTKIKTLENMLNISLYLQAVTTYSIIVPSFNQDRFIDETLGNLKDLKEEAAKKNIGIEVLVIDNCSAEPTSSIINKYKSMIDVLLVEKDKGQYDAINKGLKRISGDYWTWLNTDDLIEIAGFLKLAEKLAGNKNIDYIYGDIIYIDEHSKIIKNSTSGELSLNQLLHKDASISQPGSFFKTSFTKGVGELAPYQFAFDYEYVLKCLKNKAVTFRINTNVARFRYYATSKSGSQDHRFLEEQLQINKKNGGTLFSKLGLMLRLRILKRRVFNA